jgi:ribosomal-protein-alanine N-acetyltransferase
MIDLLTQLFAHDEPALSKADPRDAAELAVLHAASFRRGWSESEFAHLLLEQNVLTHQAVVARAIAGFIMSRRAGGEAEILSVAVGSRRRRRGIAGRLLDLHLRSLAGLGVSTVFLEVDEHNAPALRLYGRRGFQEVGRRDGYYPSSDHGKAAALVLRRDLA